MSSDPLLGAPIAGPGNGSPLSGPGVTAPSLNPASSRMRQLAVGVNPLTEPGSSVADRDISHRLLGQLVGARRPTISTAAMGSAE